MLLKDPGAPGSPLPCLVCMLEHRHNKQRRVGEVFRNFFFFFGLSTFFSVLEPPLPNSVLPPV
jgi:hypothetical protein